MLPADLPRLHWSLAAIPAIRAELQADDIEPAVWRRGIDRSTTCVSGWEWAVT